MIAGNENGVQLPVAKAFSKTVADRASELSAGVSRSSSYGEIASTRKESTVMRRTFESAAFVVIIRL